MPDEKKIENVNDSSSQKKGLKKLLETYLRKVPNVGFLLVCFFILLIYTFCLGVALSPGIFIVLAVEKLTIESFILVRVFALGCSLGLGFFLYGLTIIFVVPLVNLPFRPFVKAYRGPWFSLESIPWYIHNALTYLVRYTILDFLTPSPLNIMFFKMMGMKIGKGTVINSSNVSDPCLIELGDFVVIGGSATIMAHYAMKGYLILDKLEIGTGTTIGLNANIMGGVRIGQKVTVGPGANVLPKTIIADNEKFGVS